MQKIELKLEWNADHYDVYIPTIGEGIQATGQTQREALANASVVISHYQFAELEKQKQLKTA